MEQGATAHLLDDPLARAPKLPAPLDAWTSHSVGLTRIVLVAPQKDGARLIVVDGPATPNKLRLLGPAGEPDADDFAEVPGGDALCAGGGKVKGAWPCAGKDGAVIVWATSAAGRGWEGLWRVRRTGARRLLALPGGTQEVAVVPSPHGLDVRGAGGVSKGGLRLAALIERGSCSWGSCDRCHRWVTPRPRLFFNQIEHVFDNEKLPISYLSHISIHFLSYNGWRHSDTAATIPICRGSIGSR